MSLQYKLNKIFKQYNKTEENNSITALMLKATSSKEAVEKIIGE